MASPHSAAGPRAIPAALAVALGPSDRIALDLLRAHARAAIGRLAASRAVDLGLLALLAGLVSTLLLRASGAPHAPAPGLHVSPTAPSRVGGPLPVDAAAITMAVTVISATSAVVLGTGPLIRAAAALEALHVRLGPAADRLWEAALPLDPIPLESQPLRDWAAGCCEAVGIGLSEDGSVDQASLAARLRQIAPDGPAVTALDSGMARLRRRLAARLDARQASPDDVALACALACPDPPAALWRDVLTAALREADRSDVRRDLYLVARLMGGERPDPGRAALLFSLPLRQAAEILSAHQRLLCRELTRRRDT